LRSTGGARRLIDQAPSIIVDEKNINFDQETSNYDDYWSRYRRRRWIEQHLVARMERSVIAIDQAE